METDREPTEFSADHVDLLPRSKGAPINLPSGSTLLSSNTESAGTAAVSEVGKSAMRAHKRTALRRRFWVETACAATTGVMAVVTLLWPAWIESIVGVDPDHGSGALEWFVVAALAALSLILTAAARYELRPAHRRPGLTSP